MTKVCIREKFNTVMGLTLIIDRGEIVRVGDRIIGDDAVEYEVKGISMATHACDNDKVALIVS